MGDRIKRDMEETFTFVSERYSCVWLTGPRETGKAEMLKTLGKGEREEVSLDDLSERYLAANEPEAFLAKHPRPVTIFEVQYAPELFSYIKIAVDNGAPHGSFWLTCSHTVHLMRLAGESLAGRAALLDMSGLSQNELWDKKPLVPFSADREKIIEMAAERAPAGEDEICERMFLGSYPALAGGEAKDRDAFYSSLVGEYIGRDVRGEIPGVREIAFYNFLRAAACHVSEPLNIHALAAEARVSDDTARRWLTLLEMTQIVFFLSPYKDLWPDRDLNMAKRTVKARKMYFCDVGLAAYLMRLQSPKAVKESPQSGALFENYAVSEIKKTYTNYGVEPYMRYYRDTSNREIDIVLEEDGKLHPVQITKSAHPSRREISSFSALKRATTPLGNGIVIDMGSKLSAVDEDTIAVPVWAI